MKIRKVLLVLACLTTIAGCSSAPKTETAPIQKPSPAASQKEGLIIDVEGLKRSLGLDRSRGDLGYQERKFNTCDAGFGYTKENCREQVFVSINFRLQCRDTMGTTSEVVTSAQMDPIANKEVRWQIGKAKASTRTDHDGYAQINGIMSNLPAPKGQRLRLAVGSQFVYVRAGEVTRIVTPSNWCASN